MTIDFNKYLPEPHRFIKKYIEELDALCKEKGLIFSDTGQFDRRYFLIKGQSSVILGFFTRPDPERIYDDRAWNRISKVDHINLRQWHRGMAEGKSHECLVIQIWERNDAAVIIPLDKLDNIPRFIQKGDFKVKQENYNFYLATPRGEDNIPLKQGILFVLDYL